MDKSNIRKRLQKWRDSLSKEDRTLKSESICEKLESLDFFQHARKILFYYPQESEVQIQPLLEKYVTKKEIYLPKLSGESFIPLRYERGAKLIENKFGIPEPTDGTAPEKLDLIIVPGLAFDRKGTRLGMGKGYYDRFLAGHKDVFRIAPAFSGQILDQLPKESYDEDVHLIVTENEKIKC